MARKRQTENKEEHEERMMKRRRMGLTVTGEVRMDSRQRRMCFVEEGGELAIDAQGVAFYTSGLSFGCKFARRTRLLCTADETRHDGQHDPQTPI